MTAEVLSEQVFIKQSNNNKYEMSRLIDDLTEAELPTRYMLRDYDESMAGMIIPDHLVTRAPNGRFWKHEENVLLQIHSMDRCPTYGFCDRCCSSGPVGMHCQKCKLRNYKYHVIRRSRKILDATWVSRFFSSHAHGCVGGPTVSLVTNTDNVNRY